MIDLFKMTNEQIYIIVNLFNKIVNQGGGGTFFTFHFKKGRGERGSKRERKLILTPKTNKQGG